MTKQLTLLFAALTASASMHATVFTTEAQTSEPVMKTPSCIRKAVAPKAASTRADWKFNFTQSDIIYDQPEGELRMYSKACDYYTASMFGPVKSSSTGMPCRVVEDGKGNFYIYNPFAGIDTKTWLKATIEGDKMTVKLPQALYADSDGTENYVYVAQMCHFEWTDDSQTDGKYYTEDGETEVKFIKEGDTWVMQQPEDVNEHPMIMGLVTADDGSWCVYSDWNITLTPFSAETATPPADAAIEDWQIVYPSSEGDEYIFGKSVKAGIAGEDIYLSGISNAFPDSWIKGSIKDGNITFPSDQYLGANEMQNAFGFFYGKEEEKTYNEEWDFWFYQYHIIDNLVFEKDATSDVYTAKDCLTVVNGKNGTSTLDLIKNPRLSKKTKIDDFTPLNPIVGFYQEPGEYSGSLYFDFPVINKAAQVLDIANLYYRLYVDGELFEFYADEYPGLEDGTTDVPYSFSNQTNIGMIDGGNHFIYITFSGYETLDLQTLYKDGDTEYFSDKVRVAGNDAVNEIAAEAEVAAENWYDLFGRRVANPQKGIYLKQTVYTDGTSETAKIIVK